LEKFTYNSNDRKSFLRSFLVTLFLVFIVGFVVDTLQFYLLSKNDPGTFMLRTIFDVLAWFAYLLVSTPLMVSITRDVVLREKFDSRILERIFNEREISTVIAWFKIHVYQAVITFVVSFLLSIPMSLPLAMMMDTGAPDSNHNVSIMTVLIAILPFTGTSLYFFVRICKAAVTAPLDEGRSLRESFTSMGEQEWDLFFTLAFSFAAIIIGSGIFLYLTGQSGSYHYANYLQSLSFLGKGFLCLETSLVWLLLNTVCTVNIAKYYARVQGEL